MTLAVYLAAPYAARDHLRPLADELRSIGMTVTSSWLNEEVAIHNGTRAAAAHVRADYADINRAHVLVLFTATECARLGATWGHSGGRHIETGYAIARGKDVIVIGEPENIFHRTLQVVPDWHAAVLALVAFERAMPQADVVCAP